MYEEFRKDYEAKNVSRLLRHISPDWEAGDGTDISELGTYLRNSFSMFNEVKCTIGNLKLSLSGNHYKVTYDMAITGRIFEQNIKHEERSTVSEEVEIGKKGKPLIRRTLKGNFWYFE